MCVCVLCLSLFCVCVCVFVSLSLCVCLFVSLCDAPEFGIRVTSEDHLHFFRAFVAEFRASRYVMRLNWTFELKVMTI